MVMKSVMLGKSQPGAGMQRHSGIRGGASPGPCLHTEPPGGRQAVRSRRRRGQRLEREWTAEAIKEAEDVCAEDDEAESAYPG